MSLPTATTLPVFVTATLLFWLTLLSWSSPAFAASIYWQHYLPGSCSQMPTLAKSASAGDYGTFLYSAAPIMSSCGLPDASGSVLQMPVYPSHDAEPSTWLCDDDPTCFTDLDDVWGPWIAILDWRNWHGRSVSWIAKSVTDPSIKTVLVELEDVLPNCPGIDDLDVLIGLAKIADKADQNEDESSLLTVNMSFGRAQEQGDAIDTMCNKDTLSCQISRLLAHLTRPREPGPSAVAIASAGNHRELLYPASIKHVLAAHTMDLSLYNTSNSIWPSWESPWPSTPGAIMPGSGLCLDWGGARWPMPSGASVASAVFTGWAADVLYNHQDLAQDHFSTEPLWEPRRICEDGHCQFYLAHGETVFSTPLGRASEIIDAALSEDLAICGSSSSGSVEIEAEMELFTLKANPFAHESLVDRVASEHRPTPEPDPCLPCSLGCQIDFQQLPVIASGLKNQPRIPVTLTIDLHSSWSVTSFRRLAGLFVRIGGELHEVELSDPDLENLSKGDVEFLFLFGTLSSLQIYDQASLIWLWRSELPSTDSEIFWSSTPLIMR